MYVEIIPPETLAMFAEGNPDMPRVYYDKSRIVRWLYWRRLEWLIGFAKKYTPQGQIALDFGTGSGVLLPSLCKNYADVRAIDRYTKDARKIVDHFDLELSLVEGDANNLPFAENSVDCVFAASVLEHFQDVDRPIAQIARVLKPGGVFACSSPTENALYQVARKIFGYVKPHDHYQTARTIRTALEKKLDIKKIKHGPFPLGYQLSAYEVVIARKPS